MRKAKRTIRPQRPALSVVNKVETSPVAELQSSVRQESELAQAEEREMLTYAALARKTGIRVGTLYAMVCRGELPHFRLAPRIVRFSATEIEAWLAGRYQPARGQVQQ